MPKRELSRPIQIAEWLEDWGAKLTNPGEMILIGSGGLLWHAHQAGKTEPLPENYTRKRNEHLERHAKGRRRF